MKIRIDVETTDISLDKIIRRPDGVHFLIFVEGDTDHDFRMRHASDGTRYVSDGTYRDMYKEVYEVSLELRRHVSVLGDFGSVLDVSRFLRQNFGDEAPRYVASFGLTSKNDLTDDGPTLSPPTSPITGSGKEAGVTGEVASRSFVDKDGKFHFRLASSPKFLPYSHDTLVAIASGSRVFICKCVRGFAVEQCRMSFHSFYADERAVQAGYHFAGETNNWRRYD